MKETSYDEGKSCLLQAHHKKVIESRTGVFYIALSYIHSGDKILKNGHWRLHTKNIFIQYFLFPTKREMTERTIALAGNLQNAILQQRPVFCK